MVAEDPVFCHRPDQPGGDVGNPRDENGISSSPKMERCGEGATQDEGGGQEPGDCDFPPGNVKAAHPHPEGDAKVGDHSSEMSRAQDDPAVAGRQGILDPAPKGRKRDRHHRRAGNQDIREHKKRADPGDGPTIGTGEVEGRVVDQESGEKGTHEKGESGRTHPKQLCHHLRGAAHQVDGEFRDISREVADRGAGAQQQPDIGECGSKSEATSARENDWLNTHPKTIGWIHESRHHEKNPEVRTPRGF